MTDKQTAAHLRQWVTERHDTFSWPTDGCGDDQHITFVHHRNDNWHPTLNSDGDAYEPDITIQWLEFVLAYADTLDAPHQTAL